MDVTAVQKFRRIFRYSAVVLWCIASFLAMPLAFARLGGFPVPLFGVVQLVTLPVMTLFSLALLFLFPERLQEIFTSHELKIPGAAAALFLLILIFHFVTGQSAWDNLLASGFWITTPLAAMVMANELKKVFPFFASAGAVLLIYSGCMSDSFTGLLGNWNWTCGAITALLPGIFILYDMPYRRISALSALAIFFLLFYFFAPEYFPRSALLGALGAAMLIFIRERVPQKKFDKLLIVLLFTGIAAFTALLFAVEFSDTRFIIWDGAFNLFLSSPLTGCGNGMFAEFIRPCLPEAYFFSDFPAPHIDHAHNDLLNLLAECGIAGAIFYLTVIFSLLRRRAKTPVMELAKWSFSVMLICGCFDQHNLTVTGAFICAVSAGMLLAPARRKLSEEKVAVHVPAAITGMILLGLAVLQSANNFQAASLIRQADLKLFEYDIAGAVPLYQQSIQYQVFPAAVYQLAEVHLATGEPEKSLRYIEQLEKECHLTNFRHTQRLKAIAAFQTGDLPLAAESLQTELKNAPFSLISADFQRYLLRALNANDEAIRAGDEHFDALCTMREITPAQVRNRAFIHIDDGAFPEKTRKKYFRKN